jgi:RNA polymerase sigma-70 factor (ECF subfamily)
MLLESCTLCQDEAPQDAYEAVPSESLTDAEADLVRTFNEARGELFGKLYAMLGNYADTQDALQLAFLHCWRARDCVPQLHNLRAWIWRVALNAGRDLRDLVWRRRAKPLSLVESTARCRGISAAENLEDQERREQLRAALVHLRPEEREIVLMRQNGELTYDEIGKRRGIPPGTAKTLMRKAVQKLRRVLVEAGPN